MISGGFGTLQTVVESLKKNIPILVLAASKGCADLISFVCAAERLE